MNDRVVIGGVGYRHLRDHSFGIVMSDELEPLAEPPDFLVEDLCYGPVAVGQWFLDEAREAPITRAVFVTAVAREDGRPAGTVSAYRWDRVLPGDEDIHHAVIDAVTGVIRLDNTLVVTAWMGALPAETCVVEVEPLEHSFGDAMSTPVAAVYDGARELVLQLARSPALAATLPVAPFGGAAVYGAAPQRRPGVRL